MFLVVTNKGSTQYLQLTFASLLSQKTQTTLNRRQVVSCGQEYTQVLWQPAGVQLRNLRLTLDGTEESRRRNTGPYCAAAKLYYGYTHYGMLSLAYCYGHPLMGILSLLACIPPLLSLFSAFRPLVTVSSLYPHSSTTIVLKAGILLLYL